MARHNFEIQHQTLAEGWVNTWSDENGTPIRFTTRRAANNSLHIYLRELKLDEAVGVIGRYDESEFRVARI